MKKKIILLTGNEQRHLYSACFLSSQKNIDLKLVVHESNIKLKENVLYKKDPDFKRIWMDKLQSLMQGIKGVDKKELN